MKFSPGDRVRFTQTLYDPMVTFLAGPTARTTGLVVSFEEYSLDRLWDIGGSGFPERVKREISCGNLSPVRIEQVAPLETNEYTIHCEPIELVNTRILVLIGNDE